MLWKKQSRKREKGLGRERSNFIILNRDSWEGNILAKTLRVKALHRGNSMCQICEPGLFRQ